MRKYIKFPEFRNLFSAADELTCKQLENDGHDRLQLSSDMISDPLNDRKIDPPAKAWLGVVFAAGSGLRL